jgi:hypothetical protein
MIIQNIRIIIMNRAIVILTMLVDTTVEELLLPNNKHNQLQHKCIDLPICKIE